MSNPPPSSQQPPVDRLRPVLEAIQGHLAELTRTAAVQAEAIVEATDFVKDTADHLRVTRQSLGELHDKMDRIEALLGNFVRDTERLRSDVRERLKVRSG